MMPTNKIRRVTLWYSRNDKGVLEYNHMEFGHKASLRPKPLGDFKLQKAWAKGDWVFEHKVIDSNCQII